MDLEPISQKICHQWRVTITVISYWNHCTWLTVCYRNLTVVTDDNFLWSKVMIPHISTLQGFFYHMITVNAYHELSFNGFQHPTSQIKERDAFSPENREQVFPNDWREVWDPTLSLRNVIMCESRTSLAFWRPKNTQRRVIPFSSRVRFTMFSCGEKKLIIGYTYSCL